MMLRLWNVRNLVIAELSECGVNACSQQLPPPLWGFHCNPAFVDRNGKAEGAV